MFVLIKAKDGLIGPAATDVQTFVFGTYNDAVDRMTALVESEGGKVEKHNELFGTGYSDGKNGMYAYQIALL